VNFLCDSRLACKCSSRDSNRLPKDWKEQRKYQKIAEVLLGRDVDARAHDENGLTPLHLASRNGDMGIAQFLLEHGADLNARDSNDVTALHFASQEGHLRVVQLLLNCGAEVNGRDKENQTPLHMVSIQAVRYGFSRRLLELAAYLGSAIVKPHGLGD
jgi:ankyrin repeat protein